MCKLTIFTATYNRGHLIGRLYESLKRQNVCDFEWLIIDDGSQDNTKDLFEKWLNEENRFQIRYYCQENQGLIRALNKGVSLARGEFFAKVDSDDYVVNDFCNNILQWVDEIADCADIYGVGGVRITPDGIPLKGIWPSVSKEKGYVDATDLERRKYDLDADMAEAWRTDVLRKHPFPVWPGEKFAPEQLVLHDIAFEGLKIRWHAVPLVVCEYQEGGLTLGADKLEKENPMGYAMMYNQKLKIEKSFKRNMFYAMQMTALTLYAGNLSYLKESNNILATLLSFPFGFILSIRRKMQYSKIH